MFASKIQQLMMKALTYNESAEATSHEKGTVGEDGNAYK